MKYMQHTRGFSLVELAVVIVVIGFLVGGVVVGKDMIRAAQVQSIIVDSTRYIDAAGKFHDRYQAVPGDMATAADVWGAADADPDSCAAAVNGGRATCNGDGDGVLGGLLSDRMEARLFWQHLVNAELIEPLGLTYAPTDNACYSTTGVNAPASKLKGAGFTAGAPVTQLGGFAALDRFFAHPQGAVLYVGRDWCLGIFSGPTLDPALTPQEAYNIDRKMDDGLPGYGKVLARICNGGLGGSCTMDCSTTDDPDTADYNLTRTQVSCALAIDMGL